MSLSEVHAAIISCTTCERLRTYCALIAREKRAAYRGDTYWGKPVPGFGDPAARVLVLGLAPAAHGANRTGRVFTGDGTGGSGDFLMAAMHRAGFANIPTSRATDDGLQLKDAYIAAAVRCAPPDNKPLPEELDACLPHLDAELAQLPRVAVIVALGRIAFDTVWRWRERHGEKTRPRPAFAHGARHDTAGGLVVLGSYHPSRQNTNTGKLTPAMLEAVFLKAKASLHRI